MNKLFYFSIFIFFISGCATWNGIKEDTDDAASWSKKKVNQAAKYVKENTQ